MICFVGSIRLVDTEGLLIGVLVAPISEEDEGVALYCGFAHASGVGPRNVGVTAQHFALQALNEHQRLPAITLAMEFFGVVFGVLVHTPLFILHFVNTLIHQILFDPYIFASNQVFDLLPQFQIL